MSVKNWTLLIINSLVLLVVLTISFSFYSEFSKVLDETKNKNVKEITLLTSKRNKLTGPTYKNFKPWK